MKVTLKSINNYRVKEALPNKNVFSFFLKTTSVGNSTGFCGNVAYGSGAGGSRRFKDFTAKR